MKTLLNIITLSVIWSILPLHTQAQTHAHQVLALPSDKCARYRQNPKFLPAIGLIARNMQYSLEDLCHLPHLADLYVTNRVFYNEQGEEEPHVWVTLHYNEYSCQYFIRDLDQVVTRKNCYNTW